MLAKTLPEFADPSALTLAGFAAVSGHPSTALPFTADINGVMPSTVFATPSDVVQWSGTRVQANRAVNHQQIEVDSQNRVVVEHGWLTDSSGALQVDHSTAYGALFAYAPSTVPSSALQLSAQSASQCQSVTELNTSPSNPISSASNATVALVQPAAASRRPAITQKAGTFGVVGLSGISLASIQLPTIAGSIPGYYKCKYAYWIIGNYSEVIQGNACRTFYQMANFWWGTQADTTTMNTEYFVQTYGNAFDTCNGRDWTWRMSIPLNTSYYTNYSVSPANAGYYSDCGQYDNHVYWVQAEHAYNLGGNNGSVTVEQNAYW